MCNHGPDSQESWDAAAVRRLLLLATTRTTLPVSREYSGELRLGQGLLDDFGSGARREPDILPKVSRPDSHVRQPFSRKNVGEQQSNSTMKRAQDEEVSRLKKKHRACKTADQRGDH